MIRKMIKRFFCIVTFQLMLINPVHSQTGWHWQNPLPQGNFLTDLCFTDSIYGWAAGFNGTVMRTTDGGKKWIVVNTDFTDLIGKIDFIDRDKGWLMSYTDFSIFFSSDGGANWDSVACLNSIPPGGLFYDLSFLSDTLGFACGSDAKFVKSTDGGYSWSIVQTPIYESYLSMNFINKNEGWLVGDGPIALKTIDGGDTWSEVFLPVSPLGGFAAFKVYFKDNLNGFIAGYEDSNGILLITTDGGNNWTKHLFTNTLDNIYFSSINKGWVKDIPGNIYLTSDGGNNWSLIADSCYDFYFLNEDYAWGIFNENLIKKTTDGWITSDLQTPTITSKILWSVDALDSQYVVACGENQNIIGTTNSGKNWKIYFRSDSNNSFYDIRYLTNNKIFAVGEGGIVISTNDGGVNWDVLKLNNGFLQSIDFVNDTLGYIVGNNGVGSNVFIYKTLDSGNNWQFDTLFSTISYADKIRFPYPALGWLITNQGILRSTNFGANWNFVHNSETQFRGIAAIGNYAWIPHNNWVLITTDSGNSWEDVKVYELSPHAGQYIESISFADIFNGWVTVDGGRFFKTTDGGLTWNSEKQVSGITLYSIGLSGLQNGWAVGAGGSVLHYGDMITSAEIKTLESFPRGFMLYHNYPNPFNPSTTIKWQIPRASHVTIKIYNVIGQKIRTIVDEFENKGVHQIKFNAGGLSSGIYFYKLQAGKFVQTKKMIILK